MGSRLYVMEHLGKKTAWFGQVLTDQKSAMSHDNIVGLLDKDQVQEVMLTNYHHARLCQPGIDQSEHLSHDNIH